MTKVLKTQAQILHELVKQTGLSQRKLASRLNISQRQFRRYVAGGAAVPNHIVLALRHLVTEALSRAG